MIKLFFVSLLLLSLSPAFSQKVFHIADTSQADVVVWVTEDTVLADLFVCRVSTAGSSTGIGLWYDCQNIAEADYTISYINDPAAADIIIIFTQTPSATGWIGHRNRQYFFNKNN